MAETSTRTEIVVWEWDPERGESTAQSATVARLSVPRVDIHYGSGPGGLRIEPDVTWELIDAGVLKWVSSGSSAWAAAVPAFRVPFLRKLKPITDEDR